MSEAERKKVHKKLSDHEKQFTYLPLDILKRATNIGELILPTVAKGNVKWLDFAIGEIHKQMPTKCGRWFSELKKLRFVILIEDNESNHDASNVSIEHVTTEKTVQKQPEKQTEPEPESEPEPSTSKPMPKSKKKAMANTSIPKETPNQLTHELRSRKVNNFLKMFS